MDKSIFLESFSLAPTAEEIEQNYACRDRFLPEDDLESFDPSLEVYLPPQYQDLSAEEINSWISKDAHDLILYYEVGGKSYYAQKYCRPCWPGGASGVTIGLGYDLGFQAEKDIEAAWRSRVEPGDYDRLCGTIGKKGATARAALQSVRDIEIPWDPAFEVYQLQTVPKYSEWVLSIYPGSEKIHPHCFGALLSLVYNRGRSLKGSTRREMRNIAEHIANEQYERIPGEFRSMKRIWAGRNLSGLLKRRDAEAKLFELGLAERNRVVVVPPLPEPGLRSVSPDVDSLDTGIPVEPIFDPHRLAPTEVAGLESMYEAIPPEEQGDIADWFDEDLEGQPIARDLELERSGFSSISWIADDMLSTEYAHVLPDDRDRNVDRTFEFSVSDLDLLIRANRYQPLRGTGKIIFGLRGAMLAGDETAAQVRRYSLTLRETRPDHRNFRCVIGVYDTELGLLSGFIASTVPNRRSVYLMLTGAMASNMLPCGCYLYEVGRHSKGKYPGCLREAQKFVVLRNKSSNSFDVTDVFDPNFPFDNIHPAFTDTGDPGAHFSSFGCQVIRGRCVKYTDNHSGEWKQFREVLGLSRHGDDDNGRRYSYVLFTGLEAAIASEMRANGETNNSALIDKRLGRLRQGSEGSEVFALQEAMNLAGPDGKLGPNTKDALVKFHRSNGRPAPGVYSTADDEALGLNVLLPKPMWPVRPVTDADIPTLDTGMPGPTLGIGEDQGDGEFVLSDASDTIAAATDTPTMLESIKRARKSGHSRLDGLYLELARRSRSGETNLESLSASRIQPLESFESQESLQDAINYGKTVFARFEHSVHNLLCGDSPDDMADRRKVMAQINGAANQQFANVQNVLAGILLMKLFIIPPLNNIVAAIIVERFMKPIYQDASTAAQPYVTCVCQAWTSRLDDGSREEIA